jgi:hypothetical protein
MRRCLGGEELGERMLSAVVNNGWVYPRTRLGDFRRD